MSAVGERIKSRRMFLGLSQRQLQSEGITNAFISRIEKGDREPSLRTLLRLAENLETTALFLLTGQTTHCPVCKRGVE